MDGEIENLLASLKEKIKERLSPFINHDYVLLDLPFHTNIGDSLILAGEQLFLKSFKNIKCLYSASNMTYEDGHIGSDTLILFNGGGNFGDLYDGIRKDRNKIIKKYLENPILIFPQSSHYEDENNLREDILIYSKAKNLTICARDVNSYKFLKQNFKHNKVLLVPDMAFFLYGSLSFKDQTDSKTLFLMRKDKEILSCDYNIVPEFADCHDWPTIERKTLVYRCYIKIEQFIYLFQRNVSVHIAKVMLNWLWNEVMIPYNIRMGVRFVESYSSIYTTRLHVAILGILMGREVFIFDNSYGKNGSLYHTWLRNIPRITLVV